MFQTTVIALVTSIFVGIVSANEDFEMEMAKSIRSQIIDDDVRNTPPPPSN